jgi:hypothetical protein
MRRSGSLVFAWLIALMLVVSPVLPVGMSNAALAQTGTESPGDETPPADGTPIADPTDEPAPTETAIEPAPSETPVDDPTVDASPSEEPVSETPVETPTDTVTAEPTETTEPTSTATPDETEVDEVEFSAAALSDIVITLKCTTDPETIRVTNTGSDNIQLTSVGTYLDLVAGEPFAVDRVLKPGTTAIFQSGNGAKYGTVLTTRFILTNSAYETEGVNVETSAGTATAMCDPKPVPPPPPDAAPTDIKVELSCTSYAETIRVTNNSADGVVTIKGFASYIDPIAEEPIAIPHRTLKPGQTAIYQAGEGAKYGTVLTKEYIFTNSAYEKDGIRIATSIGKLYKACAPKPVPPERWIEVNLSQQYLIAWVGNTRVNETYVSTGKPGFDTPTGTYYVLYRYRYDTMAGCIQGECYYVPDVPWTQYFTNYGHALHGAYWHNDFGRTRSHGCINLPLWFAEWLWNWATYGTRLWSRVA